MVRMGVGPDMCCVALHPSRGAVSTSAPEPASAPRGRPAVRAREFLREHLAHGPRPGAEIEAAAEAAAIPERSLIAAASSLNVRTRKGQWWIAGMDPPRHANDDEALPARRVAGGRGAL
jgi:hypothetical protein